ncbi:MAG: manganese efflux pump MntP family protein [Anaerococcus sp.]|nr:manganese efflux pump MntP family protein [Anaerococcus sp.]
MDLITLLILAVGLSMDAFAASICKGLAEVSHSVKNSLAVGLCFGFFQGIMPVIGYFLASNFAETIRAFDHWVAFILLVFLGIQMLRESRELSCDLNRGFDFVNLIKLGIATSIDALAVGVSLAFLKINIASAGLIIGIITGILSLVGFKIGTKLGMKSKQIAELAGGLILIGLGSKIFIEHVFLA